MLFMTIVTYLARMGVGKFVKPHAGVRYVALIPLVCRLFPPPVSDCLQYAIWSRNTASIESNWW